MDRMRFLVLALLTTGVCLAQTPDCKLVPGWRQQGGARSFAADELFEYMDGNAEGYLSYGFVRLSTVSCQSGSTTIDIDVSEMVDTEAAYGVFLTSRDPRFPLEKIGVAGQVRPRRAVLVKDKYLVEMAANPEGDHSAALRAFLSAMERNIPGRTTRPDALSWFPTEKLDESSLRLLPNRVLGLALLKRGYVAQYPYGKAFVVEEESPAAATGVMEKARARFGQTQPLELGDEAFQATDKYLERLTFFRKGRYIAGFANMTAPAEAIEAAKVLASRLP